VSSMKLRVLHRSSSCLQLEGMSECVCPLLQGIYLNEHRNYGGQRSIMVTIQGQKRADGRKYGPLR
jgi:hypothetical protein